MQIGIIQLEETEVAGEGIIIGWKFLSRLNGMGSREQVVGFNHRKSV